MAEFEHYTFKITDYDLSFLPMDTHLIIADGTTALYYVSASNRKTLRKYLFASSTDSLVVTRTQDIRAAWHDRANDKIHFVDCDNDNVSVKFEYWYLDLSDDSENDVDDQERAGYDGVWGYDILMIGADVYITSLEDTGVVQVYQRVYKVIAGTITLRDTIIY